MQTATPRLELVERFFSGTGFSYDRMVRLGTSGLDARWKRLMLECLPENPARVVDQGCGTGIVTIAIASRHPLCRVTGVELREEYLLYAKAKARLLGLTNVDFVLGRAEDVVIDEACDCITSSYLAKYADLPLLVSHAEKMLRRGGLLIMHDFTYPSSALFAQIWRWYFASLRLISRRLFPEWGNVFSELPQLLRQTRWLEELPRSLRAVGFGNIQVKSLFFGTAALVTAQKA